MTTKFARAGMGLVAVLAAAATLPSTGAVADPFQHASARSDRAIPPSDVDAVLRSMRLDLLTRPVRSGVNYLARAIDRYGNEVLVTVNARVGEIVSILPLRHAPRVVVDAAPPRWGWRPAPWSDGYVPEWGELPPPRRAAVPVSPQARLRPDRLTGPHVIHAPDVTGSIRPHRSHAIGLPAEPPLPRSRPADQVASRAHAAAPVPAAAPPPQHSDADANSGGPALPPVTPPF